MSTFCASRHRPAEPRSVLGDGMVGAQRHGERAARRGRRNWTSQSNWLGTVLLLLGLPGPVQAQPAKPTPSSAKPNSDGTKPGSKSNPPPRPAVTCPDAVPGAIDDPLADEFRVHYQRSVDLYRARDYASAIAEMQRAYKLKPVSRLLYNLGQSFRKLSQPREAITYFELYLQTDSLVPTEIRAEVEGYLVDLRTLLAEQERARVVVVASRAPPPRWLRPLGGTLIALGTASVVAGAPLWAINGSCTAPPLPPLQTCDQVFATLPLGASLVGVGGGLVLTGLGLVVGSVRRGSESNVSPGRAPGTSTLLRSTPAPAAIEPKPATSTPSAPPTPNEVPDPNIEPPPAPLRLSLRSP